MKYGFTKVAAAIPTVTVADCAANTREILDLMAAAHRKGAALTVFPKLKFKIGRFKGCLLQFSPQLTNHHFQFLQITAEQVFQPL